MKRFGDIMAAAVDVDRSVPDYFNDTGGLITNHEFKAHVL
jgi:hypothetical protein